MAVIGSLILRMGADAKPLNKALDSAEGRIGRFADRGSRGGGGMLGGIGGALGGLAAAGGAAAGMNAAVNSAVKMESAMAGLAKASDLAPENLEQMKQGIFGLSTEMKGVKLDDLIAIATTGAKMGVATDELLAYTKGVAMVSVAIEDIPALEVAESLGKINTIFKLGVHGTEQMGSAIARLADSGISSASGILEVTQRLSGTAEAMHLTAAETTAMSAALLDAGANNELAASSINRLLMAMVSVESQAGFAKTMGVSVEQFAATVRDEPIVAVEGFLTSLKALSAGAQLETLGAVGIDAKVGSAEIMKLAQQVDNLKKYVGMANAEFVQQNQLQKEYAINAATNAAGMDQMNNRIQIMSASLGEKLLPIQAGAMSLFGDFATGMTEAFSRTSAVLGTWGIDVSAIFEGVGFALRNLPDLFDVVAIKITEFVINAGAQVSAWGTYLADLGDWFGRIFVNLMVGGFTSIGMTIKTLAVNFKNLWTGMMDFMEGKGFTFEWTEMFKVDGLMNAITAMPAMAEPAFVSMQDQVDEKFAAMAARGAPKVAALAKAGGAAAAVGPAAVAGALGPAAAAFVGPPKPSGLGEAKAAEYHATAAVEMGSSEALSAIARHQYGAADDKPIKDVAKTGRESLVEQRKQTITLQQILNQAGNPNLSAYTI